MYSKFIINSNWQALSSTYKFDNTLSLNNEYFVSEGNLNVSYNPFFRNIKDYSNNNYSMFFLSNQEKIQDKIKLHLPENKDNVRAGLLLFNFINKLVSDDTLFLSMSANFFNLVNIQNFGNSVFLELLFLDGNRVMIYNLQDGVYNILTLDVLDKNIKIITSTISPQLLSNYEKNNLSLNYIFDRNTNNIVFYKNLYPVDLVIYKTNTAALSSRIGDINSVKQEEVFTLVDVLDIPDINLGIDFISYKIGFDQNNLNINKLKTLYSIKNNFLGHLEYNTVVDSSVGLNFLTLKNQLNSTDNQNRSFNEDNSFRNYVTIHGGGNREEGYSFLNLNYTSNKITYKFLPDKTTWFHLPFNKNIKPININDSTFIKNGAVAGSSPLYSDKIWNKLANYSNTSNFKGSAKIENTGQWLCAWLSGGPDSGIWVDRFYNNNMFTPFEALKYASNVDYTPQYKDQYDSGIKDYPSKLTLEQGLWYAYYHVGKNTAKDILANSGSIIANGLDTFKNSQESDGDIVFDLDGDRVYNFIGNQYGIISNTNNKSEYNNFSLSFFATRKNWNVDTSYNIIGNYLETGFSFINNNKINVLSHYYRDTLLYFLNLDNEIVLTVDLKPYLYNQNTDTEYTDNIVGVFYRSLVENIFVVTKLGYIFEYTTNGTLVDSLTTVNIFDNNKIISTTYGINFGYILYSNNTVKRINFSNNSIIDIQNKDITVIGSENLQAEEYSIAVDYYNRLFKIEGRYPIIKGSNIYYISKDSDKILVYSTQDGSINDYIDKTGHLSKIKSYSFNKEDETFVIYFSGHEVYDIRGKLKETVYNRTTIPGLSSINFGFLNTGNKQIGVLQGISKNNNLYFYDLSYKNFTSVEQDTNFSKEFFNLTFDDYYQSVVGALFALPSYTIKIKLNNIIDQEETITLSTTILGEALDTGTHHFSIVLDTLKGYFAVYIDGREYSKKTFKRGKYSFNNRIRSENIVVGTTPFYSGLTYNNFYKSDQKLLYVDDMIIEKLRYYSKALSYDEVRMNYLTKFNTSELNIDIECGDRNYLDTISRVFKNNVPGKKSNLINLYINDSLLKDKSIQDAYNNIILAEAKKYLPSYVKINKIIWKDSKKNLEQMLEGFFNTENTLTNS